MALKHAQRELIGTNYRTDQLIRCMRIALSKGEDTELREAQVRLQLYCPHETKGQWFQAPQEWRRENWRPNK